MGRQETENENLNRIPNRNQHHAARSWMCSTTSVSLPKLKNRSGGDSKRRSNSADALALALQLAQLVDELVVILRFRSPSYPSGLFCTRQTREGSFPDLFPFKLSDAGEKRNDHFSKGPSVSI